MTIISGAQTSDDIIANLDKLDVSKEIFRLEPDVAVVTKILASINTDAVAGNTITNWFETPEEPKRVILTKALAAADTALYVDHPEYLRVGDALIIQPTEDVVYVTVATTVAGAATTIVRSQPAADAVKGAAISLMSRGKPESSSLTIGTHLAEEQKWNYLEIIEEGIDLSRTEANIVLEAGGDMRSILRFEAGQRYLRRMEMTYLFGKRGTHTDASSKTIRHMGGINEFIQTNVHLVNGVLSEAFFNQCLLQDMKFGSKEKWCVGSRVAISKIAGWGLSRVQTNPGKSQTYGFHVMDYITSGGELLHLVSHPLLEGKSAIDTSGFGGYMFVLDFDCFRKRYLANRNITFEPELPQADDKHQDRWIGELGMDRRNEEKCAVYKGITG